MVSLRKVASILVVVLGFTFLGAGLGSAQSLRARRMLNFPAANCIVYAGPQLTDSYSIMSNEGSSTSYVDCPTYYDASVDYSEAYVWVRDRHPSQGVECNFNALELTTSSFSGYVSPLKSSGGSTANWQKIGFGSSEMVESADWYSFGCSIPPVSSGKASGIAFYGAGGVPDPLFY